jgi:membrane fusion protein (multidrug efflux system)
MIRKLALPLTIAIVLVLLVVGNLAGIKVLQIRQLIAMKETAAPPPESVSTAVVTEERWQDTLTAIGSIAPVQGVVLTPELPGAIREIAFESGSLVAKGDLLVRQDITSEEAQFRAVQAQVDLAQLNLDRARNLRTNNMTSQSEVDTADALHKQYLANAEAIRTTIEKKTIRAPFAGQVGIRSVNLGQYLDIGKPIVSLQSLAPVYANFSLPQQQLEKLKLGLKVVVTNDAYPGRKFTGTLTAINPDLDASTRSIGLQATFENAEKLLRPGMFAQVQVLLPEEQKLLIIPATALLRAAYSDSVFVIEERPAGTNGPAALVVRQQLIRTGRMRGDFVSVEKGLQAGQRIVSAGQFKLRNGMTVTENNTLVPPASETPRPENH